MAKWEKVIAPKSDLSYICIIHMMKAENVFHMLSSDLNATLVHILIHIKYIH